MPAEFEGPRCRYCDLYARHLADYETMPATRALGSGSSRCARHWRLVCENCGTTRHFMNFAFCSQRRIFFCGECASESRAVFAPFLGFQHRTELRSPWSENWLPTIDFDEYMGRHPSLGLGHHFYSCVSPDTELPTQVEFKASQNATAMSEAEARASWDRNATAWDAHQGMAGDAIRRYITDSPVMSYINPVTGKNVLDLGCGNGYLAHTVAAAGAKVIAVDQSADMLRHARSRAPDDGMVHYVQTSLYDLSMLEPESFDLIVSNFVMQDVSDLDKAFREARRVLRPEGRLVVVITHPCYSSGPRQWMSPVPDSPRAEEYGFVTDHYLVEGTYWLEWEGFEPVPYYHRPLGRYVEALLDAGLSLTALCEPGSGSIRAEIDAHRDLNRMSRIPVACLLVAVPRPSA